MSNFNAHWCNGFIAAPIFELCTTQVWFKELHKRNPAYFAAILNKHQVRNSIRWLFLLRQLEVLGLLNNDKQYVSSSAKMHLSELYSIDTRTSPLIEKELLKLSQSISRLGELEENLKLSMTGAILLLILTRIRALGEEKFFSVLHGCSVAVQKIIHEFLAQNNLIDEDKQLLSEIGQQHLQHQYLACIESAKAFLANLSDWIDGKAESGNSSLVELFCKGMNYEEGIKLLLTELITSELTLKVNHTVVFLPSCDQTVAKSLLSTLSTLQNNIESPHKFNFSCAIQDVLSSGRQVLPAVIDQFKTVVQQSQIPLTSSLNRSPKTIVFDSLRESVLPVRNLTDTQDVIIHADEMYDVFFDSKGDVFTYKDLLATWQAYFKSWAALLNEHDSLIMASHHNLAWDTISSRLSESYSLWNEALTRMFCSLHITAESQLVLAANAGLFSNSPIKMYPHNADFCSQTLCALQKRDYIIRHPNKQDINRLVELEKLCWQHSQTPKTQLLNRIVNNPRGQFVLEKEGKILGAVYSQRIKDVAEIYQSKANNVHKLHHPQGEIVQLLAVNIDPEYQSFGYGDQLLEFMLQIGSVITGVNRVVGVTLCKKFTGEVPFEEYISRVNLEQDPVLAFHRDHGAEVVGAVDGYRPEDKENLHKGVLVSYSIHTRERRCASSVQSNDNEQSLVVRMSHQEGRDLIYNLVTGLLGDADEFMWDRPVMEMGLDSADLLKLQRLIEETFQSQFQSGFFFKYSSCEKVMAYLLEEGYVLGRYVVEQAAAPKHGDTLNVSQSEGIAIVGMACKLPGGIESPRQLWQALVQKQSLIGSFPTERCDWPEEVRELSLGGFVEGADEFDAEFFRVMPTEARRMDPQQRMLLQLAWKCLEDAGIKPRTLAGAEIGVFVGASNTDYSNLSRELKSGVAAHTASGGSLAVAANRISYYLDISGPSMLIDTACSASMVAVHQACQSLQSSECSMALVGGANLICFPELSKSYYKAGMLSKDGKCKVFDQLADGYVRSEGAVVLLLMPVGLARERKYDIKAVIKGSAVNHGGLSGGLTVPNPTKQGELIKTAWQRAGIHVDDVAYIEAHGTGTSLGDPIEVLGIQSAMDSLSKHKKKSNTTLIGSVKSNLGHLESAAGITGLLKTVLCIQHDFIPASINFSKLNDKIDLSIGNLEVVKEGKAWPKLNVEYKVAGVSSFGSGGANAHVVLSNWHDGGLNSVVEKNSNGLFVLSAMYEYQLMSYAEQIIKWIDEAAAHQSFSKFIYTMQCGRTPMRERLAIVANDFADLKGKLHCWLEKGRAGNNDWYRGSANMSFGQNALLPEYYTNTVRLAQDWVKGLVDDFDGMYDERLQVLSLPTYPFKKDRFWVARPSSHPLLGIKVPYDGEWCYTKLWTRLPKEYVFKQEEFACLSLNLISDLLLSAAKLHVAVSKTVQIQDLRFFPMCVNPFEQITIHTGCTVEDNQVKVLIWQAKQGNRVTIAKATLLDDVPMQDSQISCTDLSQFDLSEIDTSGIEKNGFTVFDLLFPVLLSDTAPQVNIARMCIYEGYDEESLTYWHFCDNQIVLFSKTKEIVCSITH